MYMLTHHSLPLPLSDYVHAHIPRIDSARPCMCSHITHCLCLYQTIYPHISLIVSLRPCKCPHITHCLCFYQTMYMFTYCLLPLPMWGLVQVHTSLIAPASIRPSTYISLIASSSIRSCTCPHITHCLWHWQTTCMLTYHLLYLQALYMFTYQSLSLPLSDHISSLIASIRPCTCPHSTHCLCLYQIMYIHITHCLPQTTCMLTCHLLPLPGPVYVHISLLASASITPCISSHIAYSLC